MDPKREKAIDELLSTEKSYLASLKLFLAEIIIPMKKDASILQITPKQVASIISNIETIANFHEVFLQELEKSRNNIASVFLKFGAFLKMYTKYINEYNQSVQTLNDLVASNKKVADFLEQKRSKCNGLDVMSFLIMPVQRIPRYVLLLKEVKRHTPDDHPEYEKLFEALNQIEAVAAHVNERMIGR